MLELRQVTKTFNRGTPNEVRSLEGVDLSINSGSFVDSGTLKLAGHEVTRWPEFKRAKFIGRVFQNPFSGTAPNLTISENLSLAARRGHRRGLGWALSARLRAEMRN